VKDAKGKGLGYFLENIPEFVWRDWKINDKGQESFYPDWDANRHLLQTSQQLCRLANLAGYTQWYKVTCDPKFNNKKAV